MHPLFIFIAKGRVLLFAAAITAFLTKCTFEDKASDYSMHSDDKAQFSSDSAQFQLLHMQRAMNERLMDSLYRNSFESLKQELFFRSDSSIVWTALKRNLPAVFYGYFKTERDSTAVLNMLIIFPEDSVINDTSVVLLNNFEVSFQSAYFDIPNADGPVERFPVYVLNLDSLDIQSTSQDLWTLRNAGRKLDIIVDKNYLFNFIAYRKAFTENNKIQNNIRILRDRWMGRLK
jgi:hypothetical protein